MTTYLKPRDVIEMLDLSEKTVYDHLNSGRIPALKVGRQWRIKESDLEALRFQPTEPSDPMPRPKRSRLRERVTSIESRRAA